MKDAVVSRPPRARRGPAHPPLDAAAAAAVDAAIAAHADRPGALLPILHDVQTALGHVPPAAVARIARALNRSRAEVHGVVTFYHDFRQQPPGQRVLRICQAESCQALGSRALTGGLEQALACRLGETSADGAVTLEPVYCLGACAASPAVMLDGRVLGRASVDRVLERLAAPKEPR